jgi:hypothetical protein
LQAGISEHFATDPERSGKALDLRAAGIPRQDERGRWADFHSFR